MITGAARGIGQEYARSLAAAGARIVVCDVKDCGATIELVKQTGGQVTAVTVDVADMASVTRMAQTALNEFGRIDGLVNNAALYGGLRGGRFDALSEEEWDAAMAVNVKGIWHCCKAVVPIMRRTGGGSIVNIASLAATYGTPFALHYTTSKAAVIGLTRGLARELGRDGIRVNAVAPSAVATEGTREFFGDKYERILEVVKAGQCIARSLAASDLTGTIIWLLTDASAFVTGQTINVDGGTVLH